MCEFCEKLKEIVEGDEVENKKVVHIPKAKLVSCTYREGAKRICGIVSYDMYDINFCPECGRRYKDE